MPRKHLIRVAEYPYHVYARSNNKEWFYIPIDEVWFLAGQVLKTVTDVYDARVQAFVLMNNHFHMVLWTPQANIDAIMNYFMREMSRKIAYRAGRINHVFGGPYKWSLIATSLHQAIVYKYVYRNPVVANLSESVLDYTYSSLRFVKKETEALFPLFDDYEGKLAQEIPKNFKKRIDWLNKPFNNKQNKLIETSLRRKEFSFSKSNTLKTVVRSLVTQK
ncbi:MAG TPA: hypothetical protein PKC21_07690 [Oligoflexia bacterium]|nr:hypothetical protein [Oligoflexia bacterium]HMR25219.1 hypothetical protein [Oligoflexia bacterium]